MRYLTLCVILFFEIFQQAGAQGLNTPESLTLRLEHIYEKAALAGFATAIVTPDSILYQKAFGFSDLYQKQPYTIDTRQPIASVSKTFIGVATAKAIELGLFSLETDINTILPFKVINPHYPDAPIKVKHLLSHTSGITDRAAAYKSGYIFCDNQEGSKKLTQSLLKAGYGNGDAAATLQSYLTDYFLPSGKLYNSKNFLKAQPGEKYNYSNIASALAAYLIEIKAGVAFSAFTRQYIFTPLKMEHTAWLTTCGADTQMAQLYNAAMIPYPRYRAASYPDGGLVTSCRELTIYLQAMINGYLGKEGVLQQPSFEQLFTPMFDKQLPPGDLDSLQPNIGMMWTFRRNGIIGHTGGDAGVTAFLFFKPEKQFGLILVANTEIEYGDRVNKQQSAAFLEIWKEMGNWGNSVVK